MFRRLFQAIGFFLFVAVKWHSGGNRINQLTYLVGCSLADTLPPMIMEFPHAIQTMSRAALKDLLKQHLFENKREHTRQNGGNVYFLNTT